MFVTSLMPQEIESGLDEIARIHHGAYAKRHFSAWLSMDKTAAYYRCLLRHAELALVARAADGTALGFAIGGRRIGDGVRAFVRTHRGYLMALLICHPVLLARHVAGRACRPWQRGERQRAAFRLLSIAVDPRAQGQGVGSALVGAFEDELRRRGIPRYGLSVHGADAPARRFYERRGLHIEARTRDLLFMAKELA